MLSRRKSTLRETFLSPLSPDIAALVRRRGSSSFAFDQMVDRKFPRADQRQGNKDDQIKRCSQPVLVQANTGVECSGHPKRGASGQYSG